MEKKATLSAASKNNNDDDDDEEEAEDMEAFINSGKLEDDDECVSDFSRKWWPEVADCIDDDAERIKQNLWWE